MMRQTLFLFPFQSCVIESVHSFNEYFLGTYWSRSWRYISEQSRQKIHALQSLHSNKGRLQTEKFSCYRRLKMKEGAIERETDKPGVQIPHIGFVSGLGVPQSCPTLPYIPYPFMFPNMNPTFLSHKSFLSVLVASIVLFENWTSMPLQQSWRSHSQCLPEASLWHSRLWCILKLSVQPHVFLAHLLLPPDHFPVSHRHTALGVKSLLLILICKFTFSMGANLKQSKQSGNNILLDKKTCWVAGAERTCTVGSLDKRRAGCRNRRRSGRGWFASQHHIFSLEKLTGLISHPNRSWDITLPQKERVIVRVQIKHSFLEVLMFLRAGSHSKLKHGCRMQIIVRTLPYMQGCDRCCVPPKV